ncbi:serine/arginine-rich splicing factor SC35-like [Camellia sinensis]|uniref:serine/arginine-rich splicing factor SC35-like n=1 Tax=Camellia sinensis TaxID=4442 RepID=UPI0010366A62|nr:serine/arginine-rich splicing factor SC35-like [Camellia sinensis]
MEDGNGGWKPVVKQRNRVFGRMKGGRDSWIIVFVDNLPDSMDPKGLFSLFNNFGVVRDVFIPNKTRRISSTRFGFVRYDCRVAANVAIQRANGLWVEDRALKVKETDFNSDQRRVVCRRP